MGEIFAQNFTDDKKLGEIIECMEDAIKLQEGIDTFVNWCKENTMELNKGKCKIITFTRIRNPIIFNYTIDGEPVKRVAETMDLGVYFDERGTFHSHYEYITGRAISTSKFVKRQRQYFSTSTLKLIYQMLVRSILEFASVIWSPHFLVHRNKIESVQKQMVLFLLGDDKRYLTEQYEIAPYTDRCQQLGIQTLARRRVNAMILFVHSIINNKYQSPHLKSMIALNTGTRMVRNPRFIILRKFNNSPFNISCRILNVAANHIDPSLPHNQFRKELFKLPDEIFENWLKL